MPPVSALELADARLLVSVLKAVASYPEHTSRVIHRLIAVSQSNALSYTTSSNLLKILITHTSPVTVSAGEISDLATAILYTESNVDLSESDLCESDLIEDTENLLWRLCEELNIKSDEPDDAIVQIARDLVVDIAASASKFTFSEVHVTSSDPKSSLFNFAKAKCFQLGYYYDDIISFADSFESLKGYQAFESWYHGVVLPYNYYHQNYALLREEYRPAREYLTLDSHEDRFEFLIKPLSTRNQPLVSKMSPRAYFSNVILPLAVYHSNDLGPSLLWIQGETVECDTIGEFELWDELLRTVLSFRNYEGGAFDTSDYTDLLRGYVLVCLYFGICKCEDVSVSALAQSRIQTQIKDTLSYLADMLGNAEVQVELGNIESVKCSSLKNFKSSPPDFVNTIIGHSAAQFVNYTLEVFSTCCSLHSLSDLTAKKFFFLKSTSTCKPQWLRKEVIQIFTRSNNQNHDQMLKALSIFCEAFVSQNPDTMKEVDRLIFENFLQTEQFTAAVDYFNNLPTTHRFPTEEAYKAVKRKFWELFEGASNLDDKIGRLKLATACLDTLDNLIGRAEVSDTTLATVIKTKHLLKAIHSLKNFKLVLVKNQPVTPKQILQKVTTASAEEKWPQFSIISIVLEQNPKSYLAHERLHKIVNDLAIFADLDLSTESFPRLQSACVESALVDGNFDFAYKQTKALITYFIDSRTMDSFNDVWLMFYQVGKYISPEWFGDYDAKVQEQKIDVLTKQREILSLAIKYTKPNAFTTDNSRLLVGQFRHVNQEITKWHDDFNLHTSDEVQDAFHSAQKHIKENLSGFINDASISGNQASEKLSNLFVSGLGWAIGAKK